MCAGEAQVTESIDACFRAGVLLSVQRALLGVATPSLRGVAMSWDDKRIQARFVYEDEDEEHVELMQEAETQVIADFAPEVAVEFCVEVVPADIVIPFSDKEIWAYLRRES
jgi:hypothetical protein